MNDGYDGFRAAAGLRNGCLISVVLWVVFMAIIYDAL